MDWISIGLLDQGSTVEVSDESTVSRHEIDSEMRSPLNGVDRDAARIRHESVVYSGLAVGQPGLLENRVAEPWQTIYSTPNAWILFRI